MAVNEELLHSMAEEAALSHYGVLGMKWGRRKNPDRVAKKKAKALSKSQKKWDRNYNKGKARAHSATKSYMNSAGIKKINSQKKYKDVDFKDPKNSKIADQHFKDFQKLYDQTYVGYTRLLFGDRPE